MAKLDTNYFLVISLFAILSISLASFASAATITLVAGKVYNSDYSKLVDGADVSVICNGTSLATTSLSDGTFAVGFETSKCSTTDNPTITAAKTGLSDLRITDVVIEIDNGVSSPSPSPSNGGGSSGGGSSGGSSYFLCGNGKCDSGENPVTCPKDCKTATTTQTNTTSAENKAAETTENTGAETSTEVKSSSGITGAVTGFVKTPAGIGVLVFIFIIVVLYIYTLTRNKGKPAGN